MSQFRFQPTTVSVAVWCVLSSAAAHATDYTKTVNLANQSITAGDTVVVNNQTGIQATGDSPVRHPLTLGDGQVSVKVTGNGTAILLSDAHGVHHLGTGTTITVENDAPTGWATGMLADKSVTVTGEALSITVENQGSGSAVGIIGKKGAHLDLGADSVINVQGYRPPDSSSVTTEGIRLTDGARLSANGLTLNAEGASYGINAQNSDVDLGRNSTVSATRTGINLRQNSSLKASGLTVSSSGAYGIALSGLEEQSLDLGSDSHLVMTGTSISPESSAALIVTRNGSSPTGEQRITAHNLTIDTERSVLMALFSGSTTINLGTFNSRHYAGVAVTGLNPKDTTQATLNKVNMDVWGGYGLYSRGENATARLSQGQLVFGANQSGEGARNYGFWGFEGGRIDAEDMTIQVEDNGNTAHTAVASSGGNVQITDSRLTQAATGDMFLSQGKASLMTVENSDIDYLASEGVVFRAQDSGKMVVNLSGNTVHHSGSLAAATEGGEIKMTAHNVALTGDIHADKDSTVDLRLQQATWRGNADNGGHIQLDDAQSQWQLTGNSAVTTLTNAGHIQLGSGLPEQSPFTLTVEGDYQGEQGQLTFDAMDLRGDDSHLHQLVIKGDSSGETAVAINHLGGQGAQTVNGIALIRVEGASKGNFTQAGRIVAGAYDYTLGRGAGDNAANWYLTSALTAPDTPIFRPEAGAYMANLYTANQLFSTRLHDRVGGTEYTDAQSGEKRHTSMWLRNVAGRTNITSGDGQLSTGSNRYVLQLGGDIAAWPTRNDGRYDLGVMAGYGRVNGKTTHRQTGHQATSHVDGYSVGMYGTYYANPQEKTGLYVDSWVQYNWFTNRVSGEGQAAESYHSKGVTASMESGYTVLVNEAQSSQGQRNRWFVQPKAQVTYMGVGMDEHKELNGTRVSGRGENNLQTRLGIRVFGQGQAVQDNGTSREFQPFIEANWLYNSEITGVLMDDTTVSQNGARHIGEVKLGLEGHMMKNTDMWFNVAQQVGAHRYTDTQGMLGIKVHF